MFTERLKAYRKDLDLNKRQMAVLLNVSESYYNTVENNKRKPSKNILAKLVKLSDKPEEFWVYGVQTKTENVTEEYLPKTFEVVNMLIDLDLCDNILPDSFIDKYSGIEKTLLKAIKKDINKIKNNKK